MVALRAALALASLAAASSSKSYCPSGTVETTDCAYETVEALNEHLFPALRELVARPFFRYYKVDLFRQCPFWDDNGGLCMNRACAVAEADEAEIPEKWRATALSQVHFSEGGSASKGCYFRDDDFCYVEDDAAPNGIYVDLALNPERFTGYAGNSAHDVWRAIYEENCFGLSEASLQAAKAGRGRSAATTSAFGLDAGAGRRGDTLAPADQCEEKKLYYRVVSGIHASISVHICAEYLDRATGQWAPNLDCYTWRLAAHPERLANVYFNYVLLVRAVARAAPYFRAYDVGVSAPRSTSEPGLVEDTTTRGAFARVLDLAAAPATAHGFDEDQFFAGPDAPALMHQFKDHFRNVSRIMDCVGCDKCRLWGKIQVSGFGTALKILFALRDKDIDPAASPNLLQRSELVALFNTFHRVAESLDAVQRFQRMHSEREAAKLQEGEGDADRQVVGDAALRPDTRTDPALVDSAWASSAAWGAAALSLLGALRRGCTGCVEYVAAWVSSAVGGDAGKAEL